MYACGDAELRPKSAAAGLHSTDSVRGSYQTGGKGDMLLLGGLRRRDRRWALFRKKKKGARE